MPNSTVERRIQLIKALNALGTAVWLLLVPISYLLGWLSAVIFVSLASIYANAISHLAAWRADADVNKEQLDRIEAELKRIRNDREQRESDNARRR